MTFDKRRIVDTYRSGEKESGTETGSAGTFPKQEKRLSIRNGVLLYKQLIRPEMDYSCPLWRSAARSHMRKLQVLQSKFDNRQIHDDLGVPYFTDHIIYLRDSTQS